MRDKINDPARLDLIREAISNIESFLAETSSYEAFSGNKILYPAVIYNLQCIGENVYRLSSEFIANHPDVEWETIEGLRHVLVHDYYAVNMETIWNILQKDMSGLKLYLESLK